MKDLIASLFPLTGIPLLVRRFLAKKRVTILLYHDPEPPVFEAHLEYLVRHYNPIPFATLVDALQRGDWSGVPDHPLVIQLDDGYRRNFDLLEMCRRHGVQPTLYVCSHLVDTRRMFWSKLKGGESQQLRLVDNARLLQKMQSEGGYTVETEYPQRQALSAAEVSAMQDCFDFQSHGRYHFSLSTLDDAALAADLEESRARVSALTGRECEHFAFPFGDHGERETEAVEKAGYRTARTTEPGWVGPGADPFRLPIVADVPPDVSVDRLRLHLTGIPRALKRTIYRVLTRHLHAARQRRAVEQRFF